jgi:uncharacterized protein YndB with AHSA1/START domain
MKTIHLHIAIRTPRERLWSVLSYYEGYGRFPGLSRTSVLRPGQGSRYGVGCVRTLTAMGSRFEEEITVFEPPSRIEYRVVRASPIPMDRQHGVIALREHDGVTELDWDITFAIPLPVLGVLLEPIFRFVIATRFGQLLRWLKSELERDATALATPTSQTP